MAIKSGSPKFNEIPWPAGTKMIHGHRYFFGTIKSLSQIPDGAKVVAQAKYNSLNYVLLDMGTMENPPLTIPKKTVQDAPESIKSKRVRSEDGVEKKARGEKKPRSRNKNGKLRKPRATKQEMIERKAKAEAKAAKGTKKRHRRTKAELMAARAKGLK